MKPLQASPISFSADVVNLPRRGMALVVEPDDAQRAALASAHELEAVEAFHADLLMAPWKKDGVKVSGRLVARVVQLCAVTGEPLQNRVETEIEALFVPENSRLSRPGDVSDGEMLLDPEGPDGPDVFSGNSIDVGQLAEEHFALALDPYPRSGGATFEPEQVPETESKGPLYDQLRRFRNRS